MELHEANRILRSVKAAMYADGCKLPPAAETDGLMMLLGKLDCDKFLAPKIKHARAAAPGSTAYKRAFDLISFFRALSVIKSGINPPVTAMSMQFLHRTVCGDLDPDAGRPRDAQVYTDGSAHTDPKYIPGSMKAIITRMNDIESSPVIGKEDFAGYLTHYMRELIILHPFARGTGFTVRLFIMLFCKIKGFSMCYYRAAPSAIREAETAAFLTDDITPLYRIFVDCLSYERTTVQKRTAPKTRRELGREAQPRAAIPGDIGDEITEYMGDMPIDDRNDGSTPITVSPEFTDGSDGDEKLPVDDDDDDEEIPLTPPDEEDIQAVKDKLKAMESESATTDADVLRRAIKLQQKITKLNEQLTELMTASKTTNKDDR